MSKPFFGYENLIPEATVTAWTEDPYYPASNLTKHRLWPGYRSADQCLVLNGIDEYAYVADHADFDITGDLTIECAICIDSASSGTIRSIITKYNSNDGYGININPQDCLSLAINGWSGGESSAVVTLQPSLPLNTWLRIRVVYNSEIPEVSFYIDGFEVARANNSMQTGCILSGILPNSMVANSTRVTIGAHQGAGQLFMGKIAYIGIDNASLDGPSYLSPSTCVGYWNANRLNQNGKITDSSPQSHELDVNGIDHGNFENSIAFQWVQFTLSSSQAPNICYIDRRHNLNTGATVSIWSGAISWIGTVLRDTFTVVAKQPLILECEGSYASWWLEIHDPENPDGYIEIPYIYLGSKLDLDRGFLNGYRHSERRHGAMLSDSVGGYTAYARSEELWEADFRLRALPGDLATVQSLASVASLGRPFVFSEDGSVARTRLVYWPDAMSPSYTHNVGDQNFVDLPLREAGGGL